ncbi:MULTISPECIES: rubrerythrin [unclassified Carboxydocella]|uniref:rubrerythrin n=1 Tax=unclassified Carboxydocella TaxID=2685367 RepID=UPI0009AEDA14|nr:MULTISPECIES: rubrerythrin family protein [unclassified Carboxydocella]GAW29077.1 rubrerythrin [Carboxydocella sp. ULO1]GAW31596.1 rubrerythrin [Carboxydocella sp. JDF658]
MSEKKTVANLLAAFAGESQARNKYTFFASIARKEGWLEIAEIFEETAKNEKEHAEVIIKLLKKLGDSKMNLKAAIEGETYEWQDMYPEFERVAREEGEEEAARFFAEVQKVEKFHAQRFQQLLKQLEEGTLLKKPETIHWQCRECGYIWEGNEPPAVCPLCGHERSYYKPMPREC